MANKKKTFTSLLGCLLATTVLSCNSNFPTIQPFQNNSVITKSSISTFMNRRAYIKTGLTHIEIMPGNRQNFTKLMEDGFDFWAMKNKYAVGTVNTKLLKKLKESQFQWNMISPQEGYTIQNDFDKGYHTYDTTLPALQNFEKQYPQLAKLYDIGDSWEKTKGLANRDIWMMRITGKGDGDKKPGIVFFGTHHAREIVTTEIPLLLIQHLLENYGKDKEITELVDTRDIWIAPMVNPDGHVKAEKGMDWRKNTNNNKTTVEDRAYGEGVDLNRNYGYKWGTGGASSSPSDPTYKGKAPFSEPETQACRDFMLAHKNLKIMMSYHSFSNLILYPWGYSESPTPDGNKLSTIAKNLADFNKYKPEQASDLYIASGITDDWSYGQLGLLSFTTEIGTWNDGFDPPYSKLPQFWNENRQGALYLIKLAGDTNSVFNSFMNPLFVSTFNR